MNKYTLSDILELPIPDTEQRDSRLREVKEYILLKSLEYYLESRDINDEVSKNIENLLSKSSHDNYPDVFSDKYPEVVQYYDYLEINMMASLMLENLTETQKIPNEANILELIDSIKAFLSERGVDLYSEKDKETFLYVL